MKRKIYKDLLNWKENSIDIPLMIIGARQIGKTYIIKEFCKNEFENYMYINLLDNPQIVDLFEQSIPTEEKFTKMQLILNEKIDLEKTIIFFDEIQLSEKLISNLKYFCESDKPFKIICAGSLLGVKINRFHSSFPVGKVKMLNLYPMDFEEFLIALDQNMYPMDFEEFLMATSTQGLIDEIYNCYNEVIPMTNALHEKLLNLYRLYLCVGGMPQAVQNIVDVNQNIFDFDKNIVNGNVTYKAPKVSPEKSVREIVASYISDLGAFLAFVIIIWLVCLWLAPKFLNDTNKFVGKKTLNVLGTGLLTLIAVPIACIILLLLQLTAGISLLTVAIYILALIVAKSIFTIVANNYLCSKLNINKNTGIFGMLIVSGVIVWVISELPYVGGIVSFIISVLGLGVLVSAILPKKAKKASDTNEVKETTKTDIKKELSENKDTKKDNKKEDK